MTHKILAPGIIEFTNVIKNTESLINKIETLDSNIIKNKGYTSLESWKPWIYKYDNPDTPTLCSYKIIPSLNELNRHDIFYNDQLEITKIFEDAIKYSVDEYCKIYSNLSKSLKSQERFAKLLKYSSGSMMPEHSDNGYTSRILSLIVYLNDDYHGGELIFKNFDLNIKPNAGSVLCFPSAFVYLHEVKKITNGIRYSYPVWFHSKQKQDLPINEKLIKNDFV